MKELLAAWVMAMSFWISNAMALADQASVTITGDSIFNAYNGTHGPYWTNGSVWAPPVPPATYSQSITHRPSTYPANTVFKWSYPAEMNEEHVYAYPNINYGIQPVYNTRIRNKPPVLQISAIKNLSATFNVSVDSSTGPDDYDFLIEFWPLSTPNPVDVSAFQNEIGIIGHQQNVSLAYVFSIPGFYFSAGGYHFWVGTRAGTAGTRRPPFTQILPVTEPNGTVPLDLTGATHTLPLKEILAELVARGLVNPNHFIAGIQCGFEIARNRGSATINSLSYVWE
jgi:hypothetical protein